MNICDFILPNFFIVGAAKAGTTSIYNYLKSHPDVYMSPVKEPNFFSKDIDPSKFRKDYKREPLIIKDENNIPDKHVAFIKDFNSYKALFKNAKGFKAIGEASTSYLYSEVAAVEIRKHIPDAKIIISLRNPIDRAFSHFLMSLKDGLTTYNDFLKEVFHDYESVKDRSWGVAHLYLDLGLYHKQVKRYLDNFPPEQVKIILFDDLINALQNVVLELFAFLNLKTNTDITTNVYNKSEIPSPLFQKVIRILNRYGIREKFIRKLPEKLKQNILKLIPKTKGNPTIDINARRVLTDFYREDIVKLSDLIGRDLSFWLES
ncbi:MAG TPA: sulfotransferase [Candidatus Marinimicrobia bacterium]|nr:sulfotransferase [Candidatus Neomarinimicrobiota bacterium]